jgi:polyhydroxybutyrate depolymerase
VLYQGGAGEDAFRDESKVTEFTSVAETIKRWR